jgi:hypothetical protein
MVRSKPSGKVVPVRASRSSKDRSRKVDKTGLARASSSGRLKHDHESQISTFCFLINDHGAWLNLMIRMVQGHSPSTHHVRNLSRNSTARGSHGCSLVALPPRSTIPSWSRCSSNSISLSTSSLSGFSRFLDSSYMTSLCPPVVLSTLRVSLKPMRSSISESNKRSPCTAAISFEAYWSYSSWGSSDSESSGSCRGRVGMGQVSPAAKGTQEERIPHFEGQVGRWRRRLDKSDQVRW